LAYFVEGEGMLKLQSTTRSDWVVDALEHLPEILLDHAHCEKKAASMAINLMFRYPEHVQLMKPLSALAREELRHFEQVLQEMNKRSMPFRRQKPSTYAGRLVQIARKDEPQRMLDIMVCASLIEARSCERMKILSEALEPVDSSLAQFYRGLLACEARHHRTYLDLLSTVFTAEEISARVEEIALHEASVLEEPDEFPRLHA
jgi:tRNA 2-(methylsulfanyl)-N6-isopentenyladenosine37 hydroxylase